MRIKSVEKNQRGPLVIKGEFSKFSKGDQVMGALRVKFMFKPDWHAKYGMITYDLYFFF